MSATRNILGYSTKHKSLLISRYLSTSKLFYSKKDNDKNLSRDKYRHPKMHEQDILDIYPEKIRYRKKYDNPFERTWGIIKDDLSEMFGKIKHHPIITRDASSAKEFEHFKKQIFPDYCDVVIIGGGLAGISCAYHLQDDSNEDFRIIVVEKDLTYSRASTKMCIGSVRQQFSLPENIMLSRYTMDFLQNANKHLALCDGYVPKIDLNLQGTLLLASEEQMPDILVNEKILRDNKCHSKLLTIREIQDRFPWINVEGVDGGILGMQREGWLDPFSLMGAMSRKCSEKGLQFVQGEVVDVNYENTGDKLIANNSTRLDVIQRARSVKVKLESGDTRDINAAIVIIATGAWSQEVGGLFGIGKYPDSLLETKIPVEPRKRYGYCFKSQRGPGLNCPFVINTDGTVFRREGLDDMYVCARSPKEEFESREDLTADDKYFHSDIKSSLIERCPSFNNLELHSSWAGFYDYNTFDQTPIVGRHPQYSNLYMCTGFSGHGTQHALGSGKAITELIFDSDFTTINLERFNFERIILDEPLKENFAY